MKLYNYTEILATPNVHLCIVFAEFLKVRFVDDKQSASNHRGPNGLRRVLLSRLSFRLAEILPFKDQTPIETTSEVSGGS